LQDYIKPGDLIERRIVLFEVAQNRRVFLLAQVRALDNLYRPPRRASLGPRAFFSLDAAMSAVRTMLDEVAGAKGNR
jgi:hypothetical protein